MKASAEELASVGFNYLGVPYSRMDCQAFVETCLKACGISLNLPGSNAWYRRMTWTGTPVECKAKFGRIPVGSFLYILKQDGREPEKYKGDGIGNASHIGIKTGRGQGAINSSKSRGGVCESKFADEGISGGWNRVGLWTEVDYGAEINRMLEGGKEETVQARVTAPSGATVNMRAAKSKSSTLVDQIKIGTIVTVLDDDGEWSRILANGKSGYMMDQFLAPADSDDQGIGEPAYDGPDLPDPDLQLLVTVNRDDLMKAYNILGDMLGYKG